MYSVAALRAVKLNYVKLRLVALIGRKKYAHYVCEEVHWKKENCEKERLKDNFQNYFRQKNRA
jgi:hypothetical protein